jgi:hypothetical protein
MIRFSKIPIDLFHVIHCYLSDYDYHEFLNTSKVLFAELKFKTVCYHLQYSDPFDDRETEVFYNIIASRVKNVSTQISISYKFDRDLYEPSANNSSRRMHHHIPIDIHALELTNCYHKDNLCFRGREGGNLHTLEIFGKFIHFNIDLSSVSAAFPFLRKIILKKCTLTDISPLVRIPSVDLFNVTLPGALTIHDDVSRTDLSKVFHDFKLLQHCFYYSTYFSVASPLITTLLPFKDVQDLTLSGDFLSVGSLPTYKMTCHYLKLWDIFLGKSQRNYFPLHLEKPKRLYFSNFDLKDLIIDNLTDLDDVHLSNCYNVNMTLFTTTKRILIDQSKFVENPLKISDLKSFQLLTYVSLSHCDIFDEEVGLFSKVRTVMINHCMKLSSLQGLGSTNIDGKKGNHHVSVSNCDNIIDFSPLNGLHRVEIHNCPGFIDGNQLQDVMNLAISYCDKIESFHMFGNVHSLRIQHCAHFVTFDGLQDVPYLDIDDCHHLTEITGLKNNQFVNILNCKLLNDKREYYNNYFSFLPHFRISCW